MKHGIVNAVIFAVAHSVLYVGIVLATDPLPSWNEGAPKRAIIEFVSKVAKEGGPEFVPPAKRIATFDNDGTLWAEQPMYFQRASSHHSLHQPLQYSTRIDWLLDGSPTFTTTFSTER
jgi:hypothetical protein